MFFHRLLALGIGVTVAATAPAKFTGTVTDADCARGGHAAMRMAPTDAECARACALIHATPFVLEGDAEVYRLSDQQAAEKFAGEKVTVVGTLDEKTRTIQVESIAAAPAP